MNNFKKVILSIILIISTGTSCFSCVFAKAEQHLNYAYAILGDILQTEGMKVVVGSGVNPEIRKELNRVGYVLDPSKEASSYLDIDIDDRIAKNLDDGTNFEVAVDYFDSSMLSSLSLRYPKYKNNNDWNFLSELSAVEKMINEAEILELRGSGSWRTKIWRLERAAMNNFLEGADIRLSTKSTFMGNSRSTVLIGAIRVKKLDTKNIIDVNVTSSNIGNIFYTGDVMKFDVSLGANTYKNLAKKYDKTEMVVEGKLYNNGGELIDIKTQKVIFNYNQENHCQIEFSPEKYDTYMLEVEVKNDEKKLNSFVKKECSYVKSSKGKITNPKGWINITRCEPSKLPEMANMVKNAGFSGIRMFYHTFKLVPTAMGRDFNEASGYHYDYESIEKMEMMRRAGLKVSSYMMSENRNSSIRFENAAPYRLPETDKAREEWLKADLACIKAAGGNALDMWQIGNEWDIVQPIGDDKHGRSVARLLKYVYPRIKEVYPNLEIGTGGICTTDDSFWKPFIEEGGLEYCDAVNIHPYTQQNDPITVDPIYGSEIKSLSLKKLRQILDENGYEDKPIYASEYGYSARKYITPGEYHQTCWIMQQYLMYMQEGLLDRATLFQLTCGEKWSDGENNFGITRFDNFSKRANGTYSAMEASGWVPYGAKSGYVMMSALNHIMYDAEYVQRDSINDDTIVYRYKKTESDSDLMTMFSRNNAEDICYDLGTNELIYYDMYGNETKMVSSDGTYHFTATLEPFFVEGNFTKFERRYTATVEPDTTIIDANYNSEYTIKIRNASGKSLKVKVTPTGKSSVKVKSVTHPDSGDGAITLQFADNAYIGVESLPLTIYDENGAYYNGNLRLVYGQTIELSTVAEYSAGEWYLVTTLANRDKQNTIKGILDCVTPDDWVEPADVEVEPNTQKQVKQKISNKGDGSKFDVSMQFITENGSGYYRSNELTFVFVGKANNINIDGVIDEWDEGFIYLDKYEQFVAMHGYANDYRGYNDLNARIAFKYDDAYLYMGAEVNDDMHICTGVDENQTWSQDSIQLGVSLDTEFKTSASNFEEISFALLDGKPSLYRHRTTQTGLSNPTGLNDYDFKVTQNGNSTFYEAKISWKDLTGNDKLNIASGEKILLSIVINENDETGRKGYFEFGGGIANIKNKAKFAEFRFVE